MLRCLRSAYIPQMTPLLESLEYLSPSTNNNGECML
jgi:hypothetical protein